MAELETPSMPPAATIRGERIKNAGKAGQIAIAAHKPILQAALLATFNPIP